MANEIVPENKLAGTSDTVWDIGIGGGSTSIEGFATDISLNRGNTVSFKINTAAIFHYKTAGCVERGKQGRCSVSDVVVRPGTAAAFFQRQTGLSAVQGLNLALFIDTKHDGVLGRIEIDPDHVEELFNELRVP